MMDFSNPDKAVGWKSVILARYRWRSIIKDLSLCVNLLFNKGVAFFFLNLEILSFQCERGLTISLSVTVPVHNSSGDLMVMS
jgi:hypothetical protein